MMQKRNAYARPKNQRRLTSVVVDLGEIDFVTEDKDTIGAFDVKFNTF